MRTLIFIGLIVSLYTYVPSAIAQNISAADSTTTENGSEQTILFFGDSITAGNGISKEDAFPALIQHKIDSLGWNFEVINGGLSGETSAGGLRRIDWLMQKKIDVMVLELGGNDGLRGIDPDETKRNLRAIIQKAKGNNPDIKILLAGMQVPPNLGKQYVSAFKQIYPTVAKQENAALIPFILEGVGGVDSLNQDDGIHPTEEGHEIVAETVWEQLKPLLRGIKAKS